MKIGMDFNSRRVRKYGFVFFIATVFVVYSFFSVMRPLEDDESLYVLTGRAMLDGALDPFRVLYYGHYSNPFHYIMGSPLAPLIYGASYNAGGILLVRMVSALFVVLSLALVYLLIRRLKGNAVVPLALIAFSGAAITLASDGFLDSVALFFLMASIYFGQGKKMLYSGVFSGLAMTTKFILVIPVAVMLLYHVSQRKWSRYLAGCLAVSVPFLMLYRNLIPVLINFLFVTKVNATSSGSAWTFINVFAMTIPACSIIAAYFAYSGKSYRKIAPYALFLLPAFSVLAYQIIFLDYNSLVRHLPYAEFSAAVFVGASLTKKTGPRAFLLLAVFAGANMWIAYSEVNNYPSYNMIVDHLGDVGGKVLALNLNSYMLIKGMPLDSTASEVYSYYYFSYDNVVDSKIEEYEAALKDGYFSYALIASYPSSKYPRYVMIEDLVRKYYCSEFESGRPNGIDVYGRCSS